MITKTLNFAVPAEKIELEIFIDEETAPYGKETWHGEILWNLCLNVLSGEIHSFTCEIENLPSEISFEVEEDDPSGRHSCQGKVRKIRISKNLCRIETNEDVIPKKITKAEAYVKKEGLDYVLSELRIF